MKKVFKVAGALSAAVLATVVVAACGTSTSTQDTGNQGPATPRQGPATTDQVVTWWGTAKGETKAVHHDLHAVTKHATDMNVIALDTDGQKLVHDAVTAENDMPPGTLAGPWRAAMEHYINAGQALSDGRYSYAISQLNQASPHLDKFTLRLHTILAS